MIDARVIAEIKERLDIVEVIGRYVNLRPVGTRWVGPCPFHQETKPSFSVNPDQGFFYCFGCQAAGDIIHFYQKINGLEFTEAVIELAQEAGVKLKKSNTASPLFSQKNKSKRKLCLALNSLAYTYFKDKLRTRQGKIARDYLLQRKISQDMIQKFGLGFSPDEWHGLESYLKSQGYTPEQGVDAGLLSQNDKGQIYDRFRGRLIFPIFNLSGQVVAFGGRVIGDGDPKYLNSSETPIYKKGEHLYGLYQARRSISQKQEVLLTEGYVDVIILHQYGFTNSCAVLGTALTETQVRRLGGLTGRVVLLFDGDEAGSKAALRSAQMVLSQGLNCKVVQLPEGEDADSLLTNYGQERFTELLGKASDGLDFCLAMISLHKSPKEVLTWARGFLLNLRDISWRAYYIPRIAQSLGLSEQELRQSLQDMRGTGRQVQESETARNQTLSLKGGPDSRDKEILTYAICFPEYIPVLAEKNIAFYLRTDWARNLWEKLIRYDSDQVLSWLDEEQKTFFVRSKLQQEALAETKEARLQEYMDFLGRENRKMTRENLRKALIRAQKKGDQQEVRRILTLLQENFRVLEEGR
jgi:DNA primase